MKFLKKNISFIALLAFLILPALIFLGNNQASAQEESSGSGNPLLNNMKTVGQGSGFASAEEETSLATIAGTIVSAALGVVGLILIIFVIYAGYLWMTAQGNEDQVEKAKIILRNSVIGLIILSSAVSISYFVMNAIRD
jgi:hypothetical protein